MSAETMPLLASPATLNTVVSMMPTAPTKADFRSAWRYCSTIAGRPDEFDELVTMMASGLAAFRLVSWTRKSVSLKANFSVMMISPAKFSFLNSASTAVWKPLP